MSNFNNTFEEIKTMISEIEEDQEKLNKGVKKASRRIRKNLSSISKLCKEGRKQALETVKEEG